jgi:hypothetical protein
MMAYLGLASEPAHVKNLAGDHVTLRTDVPYLPGLRIIVELVNSARTFSCSVFLTVGRGQSDQDGGYTFEADLSPALTNDELRALFSER